MDAAANLRFEGREIIHLKVNLVLDEFRWARKFWNSFLNCLTLRWAFPSLTFKFCRELSEVWSWGRENAMTSSLGMCSSAQVDVPLQLVTSSCIIDPNIVSTWMRICCDDCSEVWRCQLITADVLDCLFSSHNGSTKQSIFYVLNERKKKLRDDNSFWTWHIIRKDNWIIPHTKYIIAAHGFGVRQSSDGGLAA
jgi:hypothetical protein